MLAQVKNICTGNVKEASLISVVWTAIILGLLGWAYYEHLQKAIVKFWRGLEETNEKYGTCFGTSSADMATVIIGDLFHRDGALAFDRTNRKLAYITKGGKSIEILDYNFVQSWQVTWRERTSGSGAQFGGMTVGSANIRYDKVFLVITTNDIKRPIIKMSMSSRRYAEETASRLKIMINVQA